MNAVVPTEPSLTAALAEIVEDLTSRIQRGEAVDEAVLARDYPECAAELAPLLPMVRALADLGTSRHGDGVALPGSVTGTLGDFRIRRLVGRGGMGDVYEAEQVSLGRRVALKVLPFAVTLDPRQLQRFQNEARAAASLHHPNIVPVYAVGQDRGVHYFAMQYIEGSSLADHGRESAEPGDKAGSTAVNRASTQSEPSDSDRSRTVARIGKDVAEALEHAHSLGIVHRDIKPSNLLLDPRGQVWVADFGLARSRSHDLTRTGDLVGTFRYMSPEQALAKHDLVDHRTDIYSLGATLYELLTRRPAVAGEDHAAILRNIVHAEPPEPRSINPSVPRTLETIVLKAMAKEPAHRYASAGDLADDLQRFLDDRPVRARRLTVFQRTGNWARRNRAITWSAGTALVTVLVVAVVAVAISRSRIQNSLDGEIAANRDLGNSLAREVRLRADLQIELARTAWADNRLDDAKRLLAECPEDFRGPAWRDLRNATEAQVEIVTLPLPATRVAVSGDGRRAAVNLSGAEAMVIDLTTGARSPVVRCGSFLREIAFAEDGKTLIFLCSGMMISPPSRNLTKPLDGDRVQVRVAATLELLAEWPYSPRSHITLSPRGVRAAAVFGASVRVWDANSGNQVARFNTASMADGAAPSNVRHLALDSRGQTMAISFPSEIQIWDVDSMTLRTRIRKSGLTFRQSRFSPGGDRLLIQAGLDQPVVTLQERLVGWNLKDDRESFNLPVSDLIVSPLFSHDGSRIAYAEQRRLVLLDAASGRTVAILHGHTQNVQDLAFSPDDDRLYSVSRDQALATWNVRPWRAAP